MKRLLLFVATVMLAMPVVCHAGNGGRNDGSVALLHDDMDSLQLKFVTGEVSIAEVVFDDRHYASLQLDGYLPSSNVGCPELPIFSQLIEVPLCQAFVVRISEAVFDTIDAPGLPLVPVQPLRRKSDTTVQRFVMDQGVYSTNAYYGLPTALVEAIGVARDRNLARLQFSPVRFNPVSRKLIICRQATITVIYRDADVTATKEMFERYYTPAFVPAAGVLNNLYPKSVSNTAPVRYLIVSHSMFRGHLDTFVQWKRRKGFIVDVVYTDSTAVGTTSTSIANYVKSQYTNASVAKPAPTYLLLVGDVEQIPPFEGTTDADHVTDLYFTTWTTGDNVPDCYHGRFSAQNLAQLTPQIEKTLMYEQYTFADPTFLDRAVMVSGVDAGNAGDNAYTYGDPSMDYAIINYINGSHGFQQVRYFKNDTTIVPSATNVMMGSSSGSNAAFVSACYNEGAGLINYTAHGSPTCWGTPYFGTDNVPSMTNYQKFGLMIGNCCQSNTFTLDACFGEALLRRGNYCGAVGYIGASNSTYWTYDFYWTVGSRSNVSPTMSLAYNSTKAGAYDRLCHTHGESYSVWATTQGAMMMAGNMAVASKVGSGANYYWEIYHLMGDPSVMPYLTQAQVIDLGVQPIIASGTTTLTVTAVPHAYVAVTDTASHALIASAFAGTMGVATLTLPAGLAAGGYEVTASAQQHRTAFRSLQIVDVNDSDAYTFPASMVSATPLEAGGDALFTVAMQNVGSATASNVVVHWSSDNPMVSFASDSNTVSTLGANQTQVLTGGVTVVFGQQIADGTLVTITATTTWGGQSSTVSFPLYVNAPVLSTGYSAKAITVLPGDDGTVSATVTNHGHAVLPSSRLKLQSPTSLLVATPLDTASFSIAPGSSVTLHYSLHSDSLVPQNITVPLRVTLEGFYNTIDDTLRVTSTASPTETFEGGSYHLTGWSNGSNPWTFTSAVADAGSWCLRSKLNLTDDQASTVTLHCTLTHADTVRFRYKVSSEGNYDKLHFYIDNQEKFTASGEVEWTTAAYYVSAGTHNLKFTYSKDYSVSNGDDCAWIDNIILPPPTVAVNFLCDTLCQGALCVINGDTIDTEAPMTSTHVGYGTSGTVTMLDYTVMPTAHTDAEVLACDSVWINGSVYTETCDIEFTTATVYGCDSVVTVHLTVNHSVHDTTTVNVSGDSYQWGDSTYNVSGVYDRFYTTAEGCDSTVTLVLSLVEGIVDEEIGADVKITVFPSPTTGVVRFSSEVDEVVVYDASGRKLGQRQHVQTMDMGNLPAGVYTLRLIVPDGQATCRVIKR